MLAWYCVFQEGWEATSLLLGSASMSLIDPASTNRSRAKEKGCRLDVSDGQGTLVGTRSDDSESVGLTGRRALGWKHSPSPDRALTERPVAPEVDAAAADGGLSPNARAEVPLSGAKRKGKGRLLLAAKTGAQAAGGGGRGGGKGSGGGRGDTSHAARSSEGFPGRDLSGGVGPGREDRQAEDLSTESGAGNERLPPKLDGEGKQSNNATSAHDEAREEEQEKAAAGGGGGGAKAQRESPPGRESGASARPEDRRNNSKGAHESGGGDGGRDGGGGRGGGTEEIRRPDVEGGCRSEDTEIPAPIEALPDRVDTTKVGAL